MKRMSLVTVSLSALLLAGGAALAQEGTTRGGAPSAQPSTKQNSPATGQTTGNPSQSGATSGAASSMDSKAMEDEKKKNKAAPSR